MKRILMSTAIITALSTSAFAETAQTNMQTNTQVPPAAQSQATVSVGGGIFAKTSKAEDVKGDIKASTLIGKDVYIPKPESQHSAQATGNAQAPANAQATGSAQAPANTQASGNAQATGNARASAGATASEPATASDPTAGLEDVGAVSDVILSKDGKVDAVLVDVGGFLGIGSHTVALDWNALHWKRKPDAKSPADSILMVQATKQQLENAPAFKEEWLKQSATTTSYQAGSSGTQAAGAAQNTADTMTSSTGSTDQNMPDATSTAGQNTSAMTGSESQAQQQTTTGAAATASVGGTATEAIAKAQADGYSETSLAAVPRKHLTGAPVYDAKGDDAGKVSKVVVSGSSNQIEGAVLDVGGFLGIGDKAVEVKASDMTVMTKNNGKDVRVYVNLTEKQMKQLPAYKQ